MEVGEGGEKGHWRHEVSFRMGPKPGAKKNNYENNRDYLYT